VAEIHGCQVCQAFLPHPPRPVVQLGAGARLLIVGQAPGVRVHRSGIPWNDASGTRLRQWLGLDAERFYDSRFVSILPIGFCYPGRGPSGDLPPRPECAPLWHPRVLPHLESVALTVLVGRYAQAYYLGSRAGPTLADTVAAFESFLPEYLPIPHPSPRNQHWLGRHPWFERRVLPQLQARVARLSGATRFLLPIRVAPTAS
jgi:uracil-DNA glycosylase